MYKIENPYNICVIDIGSPKLGNLGWCLIDTQNDQEFTGSDLDTLFPYISSLIKHNGLILGLEAPVFVPVRTNLMIATKARKGEGRSPWSAGAGAQVLVMNLPIMIYIFNKIKSICSNISYFLNEKGFSAKAKEIMIFEALVSGKDKGSSHINDAQIMARNCTNYSKKLTLPKSILEPEDNVEYFNLAAAALLRCGISDDLNIMSTYSAIYKPDTKKHIPKETKS